VLEHLDLDVEAVDGRRAYGDVIPVPKQQHAAELQRRPGLRREAVDQDPVAGSYAILLTSADHDGRQRRIRLGHGE
jgi:hypothetical protein